MGDGFITDTATPNPAEPVIRLRLLATTDLHAHIWPFSYLTGALRPKTGLAALSQNIQKCREETPYCMLFDNGDFLQGTSLADISADEILSNPNALHPMITAMNALKYDAGTLGNHDFNYGLPVLEHCMAQADFPFVTANIRCRDPNSAALTPRHVILERHIPDDSGKLHRLRIGVFGATPPQTIQWERNHLGNRLVARDILTSARQSIKELRAAGTDFIVALSHSGIGSQAPPAFSENVSLALAEVEGVDVLIAGHSHQRFPSAEISERPGLDVAKGHFNGKPAVLPGSNGSDLGVIDLTLQLLGARWQIAQSESSLRPCLPLSLETPDDIAPTSANVLSLTRHAHEATETVVARPMGHTEHRLHGLFSPITRSGAQDFLADALRWRAKQLLVSAGAKDRPVLAATSPFNAGGRAGPLAFTDIPKGPLALRHLTQLSPFPNQLCVLSVTGAILRQWIERAVSGFNTLVPNAAPGPLLSPQSASYNFDTLHGLAYEIDLRQDALFNPLGAPIAGAGTGRLRELTCEGRPVGDTDEFYIATNSYRSSGGGGFNMLEKAPAVICGTGPLRNEVATFVEETRVFTSRLLPTWTYTPANATAFFDSHPAAEESDLPDDSPAMTRLGLQENGYCRFLVSI